MTPNHRPLTPEAFATSCRIARPTTHLHGWHSRDLGEMVEHLVAERDRAESRLACWALSEAFASLAAIGDAPCAACRWPLKSHRPGVRWARYSAAGVEHDGCLAFVAAVPAAPTPDQRAAAAECGDVSGGRWGA